MYGFNDQDNKSDFLNNEYGLKDNPQSEETKRQIQHEMDSVGDESESYINEPVDGGDKFFVLLALILLFLSSLFLTISAGKKINTKRLTTSNYESYVTITGKTVRSAISYSECYSYFTVTTDARIYDLSFDYTLTYNGTICYQGSMDIGDLESGINKTFNSSSLKPSNCYSVYTNGRNYTVNITSVSGKYHR